MAITLKAGRLNKRVDILTVSETIDDLGDSTQSTVIERTVWAEISPVTFRDSERLAASGQVEESITHRIVIRHVDGITGKHKLRFNGRIFEIAGIANVGEQGVLDEILCREEV